MAHIDDSATQRANLGFIKASMRTPLLSRAREFDLARRWRAAGDTAALHELVRAYTRLVIATAGRFRSYGLPMGDLVQEGNVGLLQAAARFEPERNVRFSTYATGWIRAAMQDYVLRNWSIVRTGTTAAQKSLFFNLRRLRSRLADPSRLTMSEGELDRIAEALGVARAEVAAMEQRLAGGDSSLNAVIGDEGEDSWQDLLADTRPTPEEAVGDAHDEDLRLGWLFSALGRLPQREQRIIQARQLEEEAKTLEELGRELGVSKERVRQLEQRALSRLRKEVLALAGTIPAAGMQATAAAAP
jgi:RNA polymerase sigma-32 factor